MSRDNGAGSAIPKGGSMNKKIGNEIDARMDPTDT